MSNSYVLKIIGEAELIEPLSDKKEYTLSVKGQVDEVSKKNLHDGNYEFKHKFKLLEASILEEGKEIKLVPKTKASVKLRRAILAYKSIMGIEGDDDEYYETAMKYLSDPDNLARILENLL